MSKQIRYVCENCSHFLKLKEGARDPIYPVVNSLCPICKTYENMSRVEEFVEKCKTCEDRKAALNGRANP